MEKEIIALLIIAAIVLGALVFIYISKKKGNKCVGCPNAKACKYAKKGGCHCAQSDFSDTDED